MTKLSADQTFKQASAHLDAGERDQAQALCNAFLKRFPGNKRIAQLRARCEAGASAPGTPGQQSTAPDNPDPPQATIQTLQTFQRKGQLAQAIAQAKELTGSYPYSINLLNFLGTVQAQAGQQADAAASFEKAIALNPKLPVLYNNLGAAHTELDQLEKAAAALRKSLALAPDAPDAMCNLAIALSRLERHEEAITMCRKAVAIDPRNVASQYNLGLMLLDNEQLDEAQASFLKVISLEPGHAQAHRKLADTLWAADKLEAAAQAYRRALQLAPDDLKARNRLAIVQKQQGLLDDALASCNAALKRDPEHSAATLNKGLLHLLRGEFAEGWKWYEAGRKGKVASKFMQMKDGLLQDLSRVKGATIFVYHEQGLGDTIQFCRYAMELRDMGASVILLVQKPLVPLLSASLEGIDVIAAHDPDGTYNFQSPLLSLPRLFNTQLTNVPAPVPYLKADPERIERWAGRLGSEGFKIGICWQGGTSGIDKGRSFQVTEFASIARLPGVRLISLVKDAGAEQLTDLPAGMQVETLGEDFDPPGAAFLDTAAVMSLCDLVITSDTSVAHLAGALGVKVWTLLQFVPDWRWQMEREDTPWYPTMRLFRQDSPGDWDSAFRKAEEALKAMIEHQDNEAADLPASEPACDMPLAPVSWGEIIDKITILEIKNEKITKQAALQNVRRELAALRELVAAKLEMTPALERLKTQLMHVNMSLWDIEDRIRDKERALDFGAEFVGLARSVYLTNDKRFALKANINELTSSAIVEEKSYQDYGPQG